MSANLASLKEIEALLRNLAATFDSGEELTPEEAQYFVRLCDSTADAIAEQRGTKDAD